MVWALAIALAAQDKDVLSDSGEYGASVLSEEDLKALSLLSRQPITMDSPQIPLSELKDHLQAATGLNFALVQIEDSEVSVTAQLKDVTVETLLNLALAPVDLSWYVEDGVVKIVPIRVVESRTVLRFYPVVTFCGFGSELTAMQLEESVSQLEPFGRAGHSVGRSGDMLVVRGTLDAHRMVLDLLNSFEAVALRRRVQLNVEVWFIAVKESTLREVRWGANRIKPEAFVELLKKAEAGGDEAALVSAGEVIGFDGQKASAFGGTERAGVRDGTQIEARPALVDEGRTVLVELTAVHGKRLDEGDGMDVYRVGTTVRAPRDAYVIAGSVAEIGGSGRRVIAVVRASVVE